MTLFPELAELGDRLERVCAANLAARPRRARRMLLIAVVVAAVLGGAAAIAAEQLSTSDVEHSLPAGTAVFIGTDPVCTVVEKDVEYHCVLARPPFHEWAQDWSNAKEETVDSTKHVNGGCVGLSSDGLEWECYLGQSAVDHGTIDQHFLGQYAPEPAHG